MSRKGFSSRGYSTRWRFPPPEGRIEADGYLWYTIPDKNTPGCILGPGLDAGDEPDEIYPCCTEIDGSLTVPPVLGGKPVTGIGDRAFCSVFPLTSVTLPDTITHIDAEAFWKCQKLKTVDWPAGLKSLDFRAFSDCSALESVVLPEGVETIPAEAFAQCHSLQTVVITAKRIIIESRAFFDCTALRNLVLPREGDIVIEDEAFLDCFSLPELLLGRNVIRIGPRAFADCTGIRKLTLLCAKEAIGDRAFANVSPDVLTADVLPAGIRARQLFAMTIPSDAAAVSMRRTEVRHLTANAVPNGIERSRLQTLVIPEGTVALPDRALSHCTKLRTLVLPASLTDICDSALDDVPKSCADTALSRWHPGIPSDAAPWLPDEPPQENIPLVSTDIREEEGCVIVGYSPYEDNPPPPPDEHTRAWEGDEISGFMPPQGAYPLEGNTWYLSLTDTRRGISLGPGTFADYEGDAVYTCYTNIKEHFIVPPAFAGLPVTKAATLAFAETRNVKTVLLPDTVHTIAPRAFSGSKHLEHIYFPVSLKDIGMIAFEDCANLSEVLFPPSLTSVGPGAFYDCTSLKTVVFQGKGSLSIGIQAFMDCSDLDTLIFPRQGPVTIEKEAFRACQALRTLILGPNIISIDTKAFASCPRLKHLILYCSREALQEHVFDNAAPDTLTAAFVPNELRRHRFASITLTEDADPNDRDAFRGVSTLHLTGAFIPPGMNRTTLRSIIVPEGTHTLLDRAFEGCTHLETLILPQSLEHIGDAAFKSIPDACLQTTLAALPPPLRESYRP